MIGFLGIVLKIGIAYTIRLSKLLKRGSDERQNFNWRLKLNWRDEMLYGFIIALLCFFVFYISSFNDNTLSVFKKFLLPILLLTVINSYNFLIRPFLRFSMSDKYITDRNLERWIYENYHKSVKLQIIHGKVNNAYAVGILSFTKTILLGQMILDKMNKKEVKCFILHELGHLKNNHILILFVTAIVDSIIFVFCFFFAWTYLFPTVHIFGGMPAKIVITILILSIVQFLFKGLVQRMLEYKADEYAANCIGVEVYSKALTALLRSKTGKRKKININHPPLKKRIAHVNKHCK
jgi:Zn-dependent protease with chaperone function